MKRLPGNHGQSEEEEGSDQGGHKQRRYDAGVDVQVLISVHFRDVTGCCVMAVGLQRAVSVLDFVGPYYKKDMRVDGKGR